MFDLNNKSIKIRVALALIMIVGVIAVIPTSASASILYVKWDAQGADDGSSWVDAYTDLQSAIAAASDGSEVWVAAGTYKPTLGTDRNSAFTLKNNVAIYGGFAGIETLRTQRKPVTNDTILSGDIGIMDNSIDNSYHVIIGSGTNNSALLDGFTVKAGNANGNTFPLYNGAGMYIDNGSPSLSNLIFSGNSAIEGGGIENFNYSNPILNHVTFSRNTAIRSGGGMLNFDHSNPKLTNVTFDSNTAGAGGGGMFNWMGDDSVASPITIPALTDWQTGTVAFSHGIEGEWDYYLWGGFANSLIKKDGIYYLYYQGSPSYDDQCDEVSRRAIGVAKSTDGIHWTKSAYNPVISWSSQGTIAEGAASSSAWVGEDGRIYVYYGANTSTGYGCYINASARLAVSEDGEHFQDLGEVLSRSDPNIWGSGDELFPVGAYSYQNQWYMYYVPNGVSLTGKLGVAIGSSFANFLQTIGLNDSSIPAWGPVSTILNGSDSVLFTNPNGGAGPINIYRFSADNPAVVNLQDSYTLPDCKQVSVVYEPNEEHWVMSCRDAVAENYIIKHAYTASVFTDVSSLTNVTFSNNLAEWGAGMANYQSSPGLTNVTFSGNSAATFGGGMYNSGSSPALTNTLFVQNSSVWGGGMYNETYSNPTLTDVIFNSNTTFAGPGNNPAASGGAIFNTDSSPVLMNVTIHGNSAEYGGGIFNNTNSSPALTNVTLSGNTAVYGGGMMVRDLVSRPILSNVTMYGNKASDTGGAIANSGTLSVNGITIYGNEAITGGGIANLGTLTVKNSILWADSGGEIDNYLGTGVAVVDYSIVQGGYAGTGNMNADPLLGPLQDNGGFTQTMALLLGSPAIDAGNDMECPAADQRGVTRPPGAHCDIGAYEYVPAVTPTDTPTYTPTDTPTNTPTSTFALTSTSTDTPTGTATPTDTPTFTPTYILTNTPTLTMTPTVLATFTPTSTATNTPTATPTSTFTPMPTYPSTYTITPTSTPTAFTVVLQPDALTGLDTYIYGGAKNTNYGTAAIMGVGEDNNINNRVARSLIRFDLSSIPANAMINSVTLSLWTSADLSSNDRTIQVYRLKVPFNETQTTWNNSSTGVSWQMAGASGANDRESTTMGSITILDNETLNIERQIALSPDKIQEMVNGTFANRGFIIIANTESNDRFDYKTSDSTSSSQRPKLVIQYSVPSGMATIIPIGTNTPFPTNTPTPTAIPSRTPVPTKTPRK